MCCIWNIAAEENQFIQFDLYDLHLEDKYDVLKVYDGSCPYSEDDNTDLVKEFTGKAKLGENFIMCTTIIITLI